MLPHDSVPLCWGEVFNAVGWPMAKDGCNILFALSFFAIRTLYWPYVSYFFWQDALTMLSGNGGEVHSAAAYYFLLTANVGLTSLQILWTKQIILAVKDGLSGDKKSD